MSVVNPTMSVFASTKKMSRFLNDTACGLLVLVVLAGTATMICQPVCAEETNAKTFMDKFTSVKQILLPAGVNYVTFSGPVISSSETVGSLSYQKSVPGAIIMYCGYFDGPGIGSTYMPVLLSSIGKEANRNMSTIPIMYTNAFGQSLFDLPGSTGYDKFHSLTSVQFFQAKEGSTPATLLVIAGLMISKSSEKSNSYPVKVSVLKFEEVERDGVLEGKFMPILSFISRVRYDDSDAALQGELGMRQIDNENMCQ